MTEQFYFGLAIGAALGFIGCIVLMVVAVFFARERGPYDDYDY